MRIILDLQSLQGLSKHRGIGRYSLELTKAIVKQAIEHEIYLLLNNHDLDAFDLIYREFKHSIPKDRIKMIEIPDKISNVYYHNQWRIQAVELIFEAYIANLAPDIIYIMSLFEGMISNSITSIHHLSTPYLKVITLYDLIPFIYPDFYLKSEISKAFFFRKFHHLKQADLLISISEASSQEAIDIFSIPNDKIVNCSVGLDEKFIHYQPNTNTFKKIAIKYKLNKKFIFYVGGNDFRKNIINLVKAFLYAPSLWDSYQLLIITSQRSLLLDEEIIQVIKHSPINFSDIILVEQVNEETLLAFYTHCSLFIFPSLHEGFGLPIIEAMACGAPVIGSNLSSIPEAIDCSEALFDPKDPYSIAEKMTQALEDEAFNLFLRNHAKTQIKNFCWEKSAQKVLHSLESIYKTKKNNRDLKLNTPTWKKKIAYLSPFPPERSGISYYSIKLVKELACFYNIVIITTQEQIIDDYLVSNFMIKNIDWFKSNAHRFDIILYQFGNSSFHSEMFDLLERYPGIIVLHDVYLSGINCWMQYNLPGKEDYFLKNLFISHGIKALYDYHYKPLVDVLRHYSCNKPVLDRALGIIVLSDYAKHLIQESYGALPKNTLQKILPPHAFQKISIDDKKTAKRSLGYTENDFLLCSFGYVTPNKLADKIISNCANLLKDHKNIFMIFIGSFDSNDYEKTLTEMIKMHHLQEKVFFKHFTEQKNYEKYLIAADGAIQLRSFSRGEMSAALLDCLSYGIPTLINVHGTNQELPDEVVFKINDAFTDGELAQAIERIYFDGYLRQMLSAACQRYLYQSYHPTKIGQQFHQTIEHFYCENQNFKEQHLIKKLGEIFSSPNKEDLEDITNTLIKNRTRFGWPKLFIDVTPFLKAQDNPTYSHSLEHLFIKNILSASLDKFETEAIYYQPKDRDYYSAIEWVSAIFSLPPPTFQDYPVELYTQDRLLIPFEPTLLQNFSFCAQIKKFHFKGLKIYFLLNTKLIFNFIEQLSSLYQKNSSCPQLNCFTYIELMICLVKTEDLSFLIKKRCSTIEEKTKLKLNFIFLNSKHSVTQQIQHILMENTSMQHKIHNEKLASPSLEHSSKNEILI